MKILNKLKIPTYVNLYLLFGLGFLLTLLDMLYHMFVQGFKPFMLALGVAILNAILLAVSAKRWRHITSNSDEDWRLSFGSVFTGLMASASFAYIIWVYNFFHFDLVEGEGGLIYFLFPFIGLLPLALILYVVALAFHRGFRQM